MHIDDKKTMADILEWLHQNPAVAGRCRNSEPLFVHITIEELAELVKYAVIDYLDWDWDKADNG